MRSGGCSNLPLLDPKGDIGSQEKTLILLALGLMLLVVISVILLTLYFAWHYRVSNTKATYAPKWAHSTSIEVVVWTIPCIIVAFLAILIWRTTHSLDPYKPLESNAAPVRVQVVALNWKWLFIYPDYGVASLNRLELPVNTPIDFDITSELLIYFLLHSSTREPDSRHGRNADAVTPHRRYPGRIGRGTVWGL